MGTGGLRGCFLRISDISKVLANKIALKLVEITTRQDNIPFYRGDLRKSITYSLSGSGPDTIITIGSNLVYAKAVHDGSPARTIRPKKGKILAWWNDKSKKKAMTPLPRGKAFSAAVKDGKIIVARKVNQPARKGNPFLLRAVNQLEQEGLGFLERDLKRFVERELGKSLK
jgi:hypothetical protein